MIANAVPPALARALFMILLTNWATVETATTQAGRNLNAELTQALADAPVADAPVDVSG